MSLNPIRPDVRKYVTKWEVIGTATGLVVGGLALGVVSGLIEAHTHWDLALNKFLLDKFNSFTGLSGAPSFNPTDVVVDATVGGSIGGAWFGFAAGRRLGHKYGVKTY